MDLNARKELADWFQNTHTTREASYDRTTQEYKINYYDAAKRAGVPLPWQNFVAEVMMVGSNIAYDFIDETKKEQRKARSR